MLVGGLVSFDLSFVMRHKHQQGQMQVVARVYPQEPLADIRVAALFCAGVSC